MMTHAAPGDASSGQEIDIVGRACETLKSGTVRQVQVTFGCPTAIVN